MGKKARKEKKAVEELLLLPVVLADEVRENGGEFFERHETGNAGAPMEAYRFPEGVAERAAQFEERAKVFGMSAGVGDGIGGSKLVTFWR